MDKASAANILQATLALDSHLNHLIKQIEALPDGEEKERLFKAAGDVMSILTGYIVFPIEDEYPELEGHDQRNKNN